VRKHYTQLTKHRYAASPVVWYETFTTRQENRMRVLEFGVLGKIFGPNRDEIQEEWRRLCNEAVHDL